MATELGPRVGIPTNEHEARRERLLERVRADGLSGYVVFDEHYIRYLTGFWFLSTERPVVLAQSARGEIAVFVPHFEVERVRAETSFANVASYPEYPGTEHPMRILARVLDDLEISGRIGADQDGYPGVLGYMGPALSAVTTASVTVLAPTIEQLIARKSEAEIGLIRQSARWCGRHR
jgi:Xaa-Pro aminopeptidase